MAWRNVAPKRGGALGKPLLTRDPEPAAALRRTRFTRFGSLGFRRTGGRLSPRRVATGAGPTGAGPTRAGPTLAGSSDFRNP